MMSPVPQFQVNCSRELAIALGCVPVRRLERPYFFPVLERPTTHHALLRTGDEEWFAWLWLIDKDHPLIEIQR